MKYTKRLNRKRKYQYYAIDKFGKLDRTPKNQYYTAIQKKIIKNLPDKKELIEGKINLQNFTYTTISKIIKEQQFYLTRVKKKFKDRIYYFDMTLDVKGKKRKIKIPLQQIYKKKITWSKIFKQLKKEVTGFILSGLEKLTPFTYKTLILHIYNKLKEDLKRPHYFDFGLNITSRKK